MEKPEFLLFGKKGEKQNSTLSRRDNVSLKRTPFASDGFLRRILLLVETRERERIESFEQGRLIIKKMFIYIFSSLILLKEIRIFFENKFFPGNDLYRIYIYIYNLDSGTAFQLTVVGRGITLHGKRKALKAI